MYDVPPQKRFLGPLLFPGGELLVSAAVDSAFGRLSVCLMPANQFLTASHYFIANPHNAPERLRASVVQRPMSCAFRRRRPLV